MQRRINVVAVLFVTMLFSLAVSNSHATMPSPPLTMNYQGSLATTGKTPVTATLSMTFAIYGADSGGSALWTETQSVSVSKGAYSVVLGSTTPIELPFDTPYYLGVTVGADSEMTPRLALTSSPYAFNVVNGAITDSGISDSAAISDAKLAQISTAAKVSGSALTGLASVPSGAGALPIANGGTGATSASGALTSLLPDQTGNGGKVLTTDGSSATWGTVSGGGGDVSTFVGDSGAGGTAGTVPAPAAGDAAAGKVLRADGTWGAVPPATGAGSGTVTDSAGRVLGRLISASATQITVLTSAGYLMNIKWDGTMGASQIYYTGTGCPGNGSYYFNSGASTPFGKQVYYSSSLNSWMVPYAIGASGAAITTAAGTITYRAFDNPTCATNSGTTISQVSTRLQTATASGLGLPSGVSYPFSAPFTF